MRYPFADLHVHSCYSDGSMTPGEIVEAAAEHQVGALAIADHDLVEGSLAARAECARRGIRLIPAVEIDSLSGGKNYHILAYGFDTQDRSFAQFLAHVRFMLDESSVRLIEAMRADHACVSLEDYFDYAHDGTLGGWKALSYLVARGIIGSIEEGIQFYPRYGVTHERAGYPTISSIAFRIRRAGGYAVLAHPGIDIEETEPGAFEAELSRFIAMGLNGVECYYPRHAEWITRSCLRVCRDAGLLVTGGSDCHGSFGRARVGEMNVRGEDVSLRELLKSKWPL